MLTKLVFLIKLILILSLPLKAFSLSFTCHALYLGPPKIPRVGTVPKKYFNPETYNTFMFTEVPLSIIIPLKAHPVPNIFRMNLPKNHWLWIPHNHIDQLAQSIHNRGYDLNFPSQVFLMPDGKLIGFNGHHTREALKNLKEKTVPAIIFLWKDIPENQKELFRTTYGGEFLNY